MHVRVFFLYIYTDGTWHPCGYSMLMRAVMLILLDILRKQLHKNNSVQLWSVMRRWLFLRNANRLVKTSY